MIRNSIDTLLRQSRLRRIRARPPACHLRVHGVALCLALGSGPAAAEWPTRGVLSATVIGPDATLTDALSTAVFVLGPDAGLALIESFPAYEAVIVDGSGKLAYSSGLTPPR